MKAALPFTCHAVLTTALTFATSVALAQGSLTFVARSPLPTAHYGMGYCNDQLAIYSVAGGSATAAYTADVYRYDIAGNLWGIGTASLTPQRFSSAAILDPSLSAGLIYVLNGQNASGGAVPLVESVRVADGTSGPSFGNPLPTTSAGSAVWNGILYCYGGSVGTTYYNNLRSYNRLTNSWTNLAPMPESKSTVGAVVNGKIYVFGGYNGVVNSNRVDAYDIASNQWQPLGTLPTTVSNQAVAVQGDWIWLVGDFTNQSYLAAYNTQTKQLRTFTSNLPPRRNAGAAVVNNQLYIWGGNTASANSSALNDMWRADVSFVVTANTMAKNLPVLDAYPNPSASGRFIITLPSRADVQLVVSDAQGRLIRELNLARNSSTYELDLGQEAAGLYLVRAQVAGQPVATCRLMRN
ncbi:kelch repeat-containing protein [Hymenobacter sp. GOD-10R]|uniref:Kelch repeat-containing protein n=1 Tax=Hymenobacter sp. GOD-10R TaxID=3093922 RepID=UPI002D7785D4|nr:kelch repeat-containing protein [Hymenobacter sp. GOD-10R]WRQ28629.1 kelch repeat-containing protein [Hymenobacter sp. GOD-10R]